MDDTTHKNRFPVEPQRGRVAGSPLVHSLALLLVTTLLAACSANDPDMAQESSPEDSSLSSFAPTTHTLPEFFPEQISLVMNQGSASGLVATSP